MIEVLVLTAVIGLVLLALLRFLLRIEGEGMTDKEFQEHSRGGGRLGNALLAVQAIFEPDKQHAVEEQRADRAEDVESGGPPRPNED